jgi:tetratricopeptide (TPR) repeat protein
VAATGHAPEAVRRELLAIAEAGRARPAAALARCEALLAEHPAFVPALCLAGNLQRRLGHPDEARAHIDAALARDPRAAPALSEAAQLAAGAGDWAAARRHLLQLVRQRPTTSDAWFNLALAEEQLGRYAEAASTYERALGLSPPRPREIKVRLAGVLAAGGDARGAKTRYDEVLAEAPDDADALLGRGQLALAAGALDEARADFREAVTRRPDFAEAWQQLLESRRIERPDDEDLAAVRALVDGGTLPAPGEERLRYALGKACDDLGDYAEAFEHYARANELKRARLPEFDRSAWAREAAALAASAARARPPAASEARPVPVFIVGLPRSGTTLVDQILTSHPDARGVGEEPWFDRALAGTPAAAWTGLDPERRAAIGRSCRDRLDAVGGKLVTNKFPAHFRHLGLIASVLPGARFVHVMRDVRDTALSIYCQDFAVGNAYANDLEDIAAYVNGYREIMAAWREALGEAILEVRYEALVSEPAPVARRLVEFAGLPWHEACLDFTRNRRTVDTLSRWQVRQPIYGSSVGRWRNYEAGLAPLLAALEPAVRG